VKRADDAKDVHELTDELTEASDVAIEAWIDLMPPGIDVVVDEFLEFGEI
jgi:hypothetical protein